jgi:hypothetical protein
MKTGKKSSPGLPPQILIDFARLPGVKVLTAHHEILATCLFLASSLAMI